MRVSKLLLIGCVLLFSAASFVFAQESGTPSPLYCANLTATLLFGSRDSSTAGQVTELQKFLSGYYDLDPVVYITGYFGTLTQQNVQRFQCDKEIACSADESGWGIVGPRTRAAIAAVCGNGSVGEGGGGTGNPLAPFVSITVNNEESTNVLPGTVYTIGWHSSKAFSCFLESSYGNGGTSSHFVAPNTSGTAYGVTIGGMARYTFSCQNSYGNESKTATVRDVQNTNRSCTLDGVTVPHGQSYLFYSASVVESPARCESVSQSRMCIDGALTGSLVYNKADCSAQKFF